MYKILFCFLFILFPIGTFADCDISTCASYDGHEIIDGGFNGCSCEECQARYYNNNNTNSQTCISCSDYNFDSMNTGKKLNVNDTTIGNSECPWICEQHWYKFDNLCYHCPVGSLTDNDGATSISQCNCPQNYHKHYTDSPTFDYCFTCGTGAHYDSGTGSCVCDNQYANGTWTDNNGLRTYSCTCPQNSTAVGGVCKCDGDNYYMTGTTDNYSCASCGPNQISQGGTCICNERYYGSHADGCTACPSGTQVATLGPTTTNADCRAHSGTKFCDANGQNCMKLLQ